jgi:NADH-quinone oxidoreductase subunit J
MTTTELVHYAVFFLFAAVTLGGAVGVTAARSVFGSALFLVLSLFGVAGLYVTLNAGFLAVVQILIYVGAISVLFLFTVMLTPQVMGEERLANTQWATAGIIAMIVFGLLAVLGHRSPWPIRGEDVRPMVGTVVLAEDETGPHGMTYAQAQAIPGAVQEKNAAGASVVRVPGTVDRIGRAFVTDYLLPFEVISVILLVALVGAIAIARE